MHLAFSNRMRARKLLKARALLLPIFSQPTLEYPQLRLRVFASQAPAFPPLKSEAVALVVDRPQARVVNRDRPNLGDQPVQRGTLFALNLGLLAAEELLDRTRAGEYRGVGCLFHFEYT